MLNVTESASVRLSSVSVRTLTCDCEIVDLTLGWVAINWLVPALVTVCGQVNHLSI